MSLSFKPHKIYNDQPKKEEELLDKETEKATEEVVARLIDHLSLIKGYNDRLGSIDYLINNAENLAGNLRYTTDDLSLLKAISVVRGNINYVDFSLFKIATETILENYSNMALDAISRVS